MIRFSLLHPSRNRTAMAGEAIAEWQRKRSGKHEIEYILSIDADDEDVAGYRMLAERTGVQIIVNRNHSLVDAVNRAAELSSGDVLVVVSDDFSCPECWDEQIANVLGDRRDAAVFVHDGCTGRIMTLPILGRELYRELGYVYYPDYFSMWCDDDITRTAAVRGKLIDARHLLFQHQHCSMGLSPFDATYARENSNYAWWVGWRVFEKRRAAQFGLRARSPRLFLHDRWVDVRYLVRIYGSRIKGLLRALRQ